MRDHNSETQKEYLVILFSSGHSLKEAYAQLKTVFRDSTIELHECYDCFNGYREQMYYEGNTNSDNSPPVKRAKLVLAEKIVDKIRIEEFDEQSIDDWDPETQKAYLKQSFEDGASLTEAHKVLRKTFGRKRLGLEASHAYFTELRENRKRKRRAESRQVLSEESMKEKEIESEVMSKTRKDMAELKRKLEITTSVKLRRTSYLEDIIDYFDQPKNESPLLVFIHEKFIQIQGIVHVRFIEAPLDGCYVTRESSRKEYHETDFVDLAMSTLMRLIRSSMSKFCYLHFHWLTDKVEVRDEYTTEAWLKFMRVLNTIRREINHFCPDGFFLSFKHVENFRKLDFMKFTDPEWVRFCMKGESEMIKLDSINEINDMDDDDIASVLCFHVRLSFDEEHVPRKVRE